MNDNINVDKNNKTEDIENAVRFGNNETSADFATNGTHKFIMNPTGSSILRVQERALDSASAGATLNISVKRIIEAAQ